MMRQEAEKRLQKLKGWSLTDKSIEKNFKFRDFRQAVEFVNKVADAAESENHHPDILLWSWNNVKINLTTHSAGGLSEKDFKVAEKIDNIPLS